MGPEDIVIVIIEIVGIEISSVSSKIVPPLLYVYVEVIGIEHENENKVNTVI